MTKRTATTARGKRFLRDNGPKLVENGKQTVIVRGQSGQDVEALLSDIYTLTKPLSVNLKHRKETERPFEDSTRLEKLCRVNNAAQFVFGSKTKKHPLRLVFGRTFDTQLLDMLEVEVTNYVSSSKFSLKNPPSLGSKPLIVFQGPAFSHQPAAERVRSLLLDLFRGSAPSEMSLEAVQHAIVVTAAESGVYHFRVYRLNLKKTGSKLPFADLAEMGPRFDFTLGRERAADFNLMKAATAKPKAEHQSKIPVNEEKERKKVSKKNISTNVLGQKVGRIHLGRQDMTKLYTPHHNKRAAPSNGKRVKKA